MIYFRSVQNDLLFRAIGRSANPGVPVLFGGHNLPPLVEIGKSGVAMAPPAPPGTTGLASYIFAIVLENSDYLPIKCGQCLVCFFENGMKVCFRTPVLILG